MKKLIDSETFRNEKSLPFYYIKLEERLYSGMKRDIVDKWIDENISGDWWYTDGLTYVFSTKEDSVLFALHYKSGLFSADNGNLEFIRDNWLEELSESSEGLEE